MAFSNAHFGLGIGSQFLDGVACTGSETMLTSCSSDSSVYCSSGHNEDAGVRCQGAYTFIQPSCNTTMFLNVCITVDSVGSTCTYGDVRLVDGRNQYEGRVEVCINNEWGTVCDNSWGSVDATTVCKQLGYAYTSAGSAYANAYFGQGTGSIFMDYVQCLSTNTKLLQCSSNPILQVSSNCGHDDDAGVGCEGITQANR